jgi:hypothetical protein
MKTFTCIILLTVAAAAQQTPAQTSPPSSQHAEILVVGVYHMANPGHDIYNTQADDVLAPKRQAEMAQLMELLKRFHPTKIAVERDAWDKRIGADYADYLSGKHELTRNEVEQVGFRLAKERGHKTVYPVDADGEFLYQHLVNYAKATGHSKELEAIMSGFEAKTKAQSQYLASHTVLETLLYMNADDKPAQEIGLYYRMAAMGEEGDWAGADLLAEWVRRNARIYTNIVRLIDSPADRILVIYGSGHLGWLQHDLASNPDLRLRKLAEFAK